MDKFIEGLDRQFAQLHGDAHKLIEAISPELLYHQPPGKSNSLPLHSCGEHVLRSAAIVEQTFGGTTNLWDDPFEWTLPETLPTPDKVAGYLDEVEATRRRGFQLFQSDEDSKETDHAQGPAGKQPAGVHRLCEGQPGQDAVRLRRHGLGHASRLRAAEPGDRDQHHACAVSRGRSRHAGYDRRRIDYVCPIASTAIPHIEGNTVKALAILKTRSPILPNLASAQEQGLAGFEAYFWDAFFLPKGTPPAIVKKLHEATIATMETPAVQARLKEIGAEVVAPDRRSPEYLQKFVEREIEKWAGPIRAAGVTAD